MENSEIPHLQGEELIDNKEAGKNFENFIDISAKINKCETNLEAKKKTEELKFGRNSKSENSLMYEEKSEDLENSLKKHAIRSTKSLTFNTDSKDLEKKISCMNLYRNDTELDLGKESKYEEKSKLSNINNLSPSSTTSSTVYKDNMILQNETSTKNIQVDYNKNCSKESLKNTDKPLQNKINKIVKKTQRKVKSNSDSFIDRIKKEFGKSELKEARRYAVLSRAKEIEERKKLQAAEKAKCKENRVHVYQRETAKTDQEAKLLCTEQPSHKEIRYEKVLQNAKQLRELKNKKTLDRISEKERKMKELQKKKEIEIRKREPFLYKKTDNNLSDEKYQEILKQHQKRGFNV